MQLPGSQGTVGGEISPYGMALGISYPKVDFDQLFAAIARAEPAWRKAGPEAWVGVSLEVLTRVNKRSFEVAHAVMHTTGQAFVMSFQAGCPHAQDRGSPVSAARRIRAIPGRRDDAREPHAYAGRPTARPAEDHGRPG